MYVLSCLVVSPHSHCCPSRSPPAVSFFLTGFGSMVHLKNNLPADISVSTTKFAYGLAVAGFAAAFISFVLQVADLQSTGFKTQADADGAKPVHVAHTLVLPGYRVFIREWPSPPLLCCVCVRARRVCPRCGLLLDSPVCVPPSLAVQVW